MTDINELAVTTLRGFHHGWDAGEFIVQAADNMHAGFNGFYDCRNPRFINKTAAVCKAQHESVGAGIDRLIDSH